MISPPLLYTHLPVLLLLPLALENVVGNLSAAPLLLSVPSPLVPALEELHESEENLEHGETSAGGFKGLSPTFSS